jgi:uncharacterized cupin superfamily protein
MKVEVEAKVTYTCYLSQEDEQKVRNHIEENGGDFSTAVWECYCNNEINLYYNSTESDFSTEEVLSVEE